MFVLIALALALSSNLERVPLWIAGALAFLLLWPAARQIRRRFTRLTVKEDKLRYQAGMLSKVTRSFPLGRIQDVRVEQSVVQRLFGIGDLSIDTASESGPLVMRNIDSPHEIADAIAEASHQKSGRGQGL